MVSVVCVLSMAAVALGEELPGARDKSAYTLFNPTPDALLRELAPDRPDTTESPYTVDAGRVQVEMSLVDYTRDDHNDARTDLEAWTFGATNLKVGVAHNMDVQFVFDAYTDVDERDEATGATFRGDGFADVQVRWKINLWGNDGGASALGVMPYVQLPAGDDDLSSDHVEGGIIVPYAVDLGEGWGLGVMGEVDFVYDDSDDDYDTQFVHTAVLGHDIIGDLGGYIEYIGIVSGDADADYQALLGLGLTYQLNANTLLDVGTNVGLNEEAEDVNVFAGITMRF